MKWQCYEWSCGSAVVVNALRFFGINVHEKHVMQFSKTVAPSNCRHCLRLKKLKKSKCKCDKCKICLELNVLKNTECLIGTDELGVIDALKHFGGKDIKVTEYKTKIKNNSWRWAKNSLKRGRVIIVCVDEWAHWAIAIGISGSRITIFDSYPSKKNKNVNGVHVLDKEGFMKRWWCGEVYAIAVELK